MKHLRLLILLYIIIFLVTSAGTVYGSNVRIAVIQVKTSPELYTPALEGIIDTLGSAGFIEGRNLTIDRYDAHGNVQIAAEMIKKIKATQYRLIISLGTQTTQMLQSSQLNSIPVVFTPVLDPVESGLIKDIAGSGTNYAGASHSQSTYNQFSCLLELLPNIKRVGAILREGNNSPSIQVEELRRDAESLGLQEVVVSKAANAADISRATNEIINKIDALFIPADILLSGPQGKEAVDIANANRIPVISALADPVEYGALISVYTDLKKLGLLTGEMILKILNGADPGTMPIVYQQTPNILLNKITADRLDIKVPSGFAAKVTGVIGKNVIFSREK